MTITYTRPPATDLGFLCNKNPARPQSFELSFGKAHIFYPEASLEKCTAALLIDIDPVQLAREHRGSDGESLFDYVNDRPYVASSFLSVAISRVYGAALGRRSKERPELVKQPLPLQAMIVMVRCPGGEATIRRLFEPLGYDVDIQGYMLDKQFPEWGESRYYTVTLTANCLLSNLLSHIYVLVPVIDRDKHYWVGDDEVEKLLRHGSGWLSDHPEREYIAKHYLRRQRYLINQALSRLLEEDAPEPEEVMEVLDVEREPEDRNLKLNQQRLGTVIAVLKGATARRVIDLGCGEGNLLALMLKDQHFTEIAGVDVSPRSLERARERLRLDSIPEKQKERIKLFQGSLTYRDQRFKGYDAAVLSEAIEHLDPDRIAALERVVFEFARPGTVVLTTPNREFNARYDNMPTGSMRHRDHRFE